MERSTILNRKVHYKRPCSLYLYLMMGNVWIFGVPRQVAKVSPDASLWQHKRGRPVTFQGFLDVDLHANSMSVCKCVKKESTLSLLQQDLAVYFDRVTRFKYVDVYMYIYTQIYILCICKNTYMYNQYTNIYVYTYIALHRYEQIHRYETQIYYIQIH